ncbi:MAG: hypothetical protein JSV66_14260 [Trueperaceae bacterium]|nr:MAG: hypothetical protein JSV66_14260 [Trueperaceae bacterium]
MRKLIFLFLLVLGTAVAQSGTLEIAVDQQPVGLDPHIATAFSSRNVYDQIYDGLLEVNAGLQLEPALAESFSVSDDGLTYRFVLRDGISFHNGRALTSEDVVYSYERVMAEETGSPQASRFTGVASVIAIDDRTVEFTLAEAFAPFLANVPNLKIVPQEVVEANGDLQQVAVGTGPFVLKEFVPDTFFLLEANPNYYREGQPGVAALKFNVVADSSTRAAGLRTGTFHFVPAVDFATAEILRGQSGVTLVGTQDLAYSLLGINTTRPPLNNAVVREAINLAIDRDEIVEAAYFGNALPGGPLSPGLTDWALDTGEYSCYRHDADAARELLANAGAEGFELEIITFGTMQIVLDVAQIVQAQLKDAGIDATLTVEEFGNFVQRWRNSDFDAFVSLNGGNIDPDGYLFRTFHSGGSTNVFKYDNVAIDALLEAGRINTASKTRQDVYSQIQRLLACDGPIAHVAYGTLFTAHRDNVNGFQPVPDRSLRYLRTVTLE